jgi:hypothetical protein
MHFILRPVSVAPSCFGLLNFASSRRSTYVARDMLRCNSDCDEFASAGQCKATISLGAETRVDTLFTIDPGSVSTLDQIVKGYIASSLVRDGFGGFNVAYLAAVAGVNDQRYVDRFTNILSSGDAAYAAVLAM